MAGSILNQIINGTGFNSSGKNKKKAQRKRMALRQGSSGLVDKLNPFRADQWTLERRSRREEVKDRYFKEKKQLKKKERRAENRMKAELAREKKQIRSHYRVNKLDENDPRLKKARKKAQKKIAKEERQMKRQHHRHWSDTYNDLKNKREKQYHDITKSMKKEYRNTNTPGGGNSPSPWQF